MTQENVLVEISSAGSVPRHAYAALRDLRDVERIEQVPITERITRWDFALNLLDGCRHAPSRAALHATNNGAVDGDLITWSFSQLQAHSYQVANLLRSAGLGANDTFAILSPTVPGLFATMLGGLLAAKPFPINWMLDGEAIAALMKAARVKAVIALGPTPGFAIWDNVTQALRSYAPGELAPRVFTLHDPFGAAHENDLLTAAAQHSGDALAFERPTAQDDDIACYVHSGGTTGHPKIVKVLHRGMVYRQWAANLGLAFTPDDVVLSDTPLYHIGGLLVRGLVSTANGNTTIIPSMHGARDKTYLKNYWRYVERFGVTQVSGVPTTLSVLAKNPPTTENISSLRPFFATGSTAMAPAVQERVQQVTGARVLQSYGLTENTSHVSLEFRDGVPAAGSSGIRLPYMKVRVVKMDKTNGSTRDCAPGENGMILVGGPGVAGGYLNPQQNVGAFLDDGYFVTGDLGNVDADGQLRISGREKDLIIRSGHNIEPGLIENVLVQFPGVLLAAAVGKPDAYAGELPIAFVELHPGAQVDLAELLRFASEHIAERPAVPKEIFILDKLPLTSVGKPMKHLLQLQAAKKVFQEALGALPGAWTLDVQNTGGSGLLVRVAIASGDAAAMKMANDILATFSVPFVVEPA